MKKILEMEKSRIVECLSLTVSVIFVKIRKGRP